ncbi:hypothetical protein EZV62_013404 [Acer yangbiense]|uniref:Sulfite exporter TauE/SafE family protein n=1 Tax=Acer yangbiense TaxID=1000413 RepID=A0A5C7HY55_9ROSI|nr:hypothetical protein EZV62_013404 [Acer yangbiense]
MPCRAKLLISCGNLVSLVTQMFGHIIGFFGAAFGSVGGGGIFVPMLSLIIGFDAKSSTAISKCKRLMNLSC